MHDYNVLMNERVTMILRYTDVGDSGTIGIRYNIFLGKKVLQNRVQRTNQGTLSDLEF